MTSIQSRLFYWLLRFSKSRSPLADRNTTLAQQRAMMDEMSKRYEKYFPADVKRQSVRVEERNAEWLKPQNAIENRVLLYLHGGAFTMGSLSEGRNLAALLALACRATTLSLDYRLAPEHPFPAALEDGVAAYRWLLAQGFCAKQVALVGESAGGNLALVTVIALRDAGDPLPAAVVALSPITDLTLNGETITSRRKQDPMLTREWVHSHIIRYTNGRDPSLPLISPLYADLHGLSPMLIQAGENEILFSDSVSLAEKARRTGVDVTLEIEKGMWHVWHKFAMLPESKEAIERIGKFVCMKFDHAGGHFSV